MMSIVMGFFGSDEQRSNMKAVKVMHERRGILLKIYSGQTFKNHADFALEPKSGYAIFAPGANVRIEQIWRVLYAV
jgi:hypothetical protein